MRRIRVLVVDDAVVIRRLVTDILLEDSSLEVVGTAANGRIALAKIPQVNPDVVTLDVEMPELNGLEALAEIRKTYPSRPVIMFSTLTERGATDYVTKPANVGSETVARQRLRDELIPKIKLFCARAAGIEVAPPVVKPARLRLHQAPPEISCRPAVDALFRSVAKLYQARTLAVVLTGMGPDGLRGCEEIREAGGQVLVQDEDSSVVWGMPGFVAHAGLADKVLPLDQLGPEVVRRVWRGRTKAPLEAEPAQAQSGM